MLKGKFIDISAYIKKTETLQVISLMMHLKLLEKQEQIKPKKHQTERNNKYQGQD
jgi:hypothetical protein